MDHDEIKKSAVKHVIKLTCQRVIGVGLYLLAAGSPGDARGITYIALYLIFSFAGIVIVFNDGNETLSARERSRTSTRGWDKILLPVIWLFVFFIIYTSIGDAI